MNDIQVKVKEEQDAHRVLSIEISSTRVKKEREKVLSRLAKSVKVPGFRPGKTPWEILEAKFKDNIKAELMDEVLTNAYREALAQEELTPISQPEFSNVQSLLDSSMSFEAAFDVEPRVEVKRYKGFKLEKRAVKVTDREVEQVLERLRRERAIARPVERPAASGDLATIEFAPLEAEGKPDNSEEKQRVDVLLGEKSVLEEIESGITGMKPGEQREITITYPPDYFVERLRGSTKRLSLTLLGLKEMTIPALDDEFAKNIDPSKDLSSLQEEVRRRLGDEKEREARGELVEKIIDLVIEANPFEPPKIIVENALDDFLEKMRGEREKSGEAFDPERVRELYRPGVVRLFKKTFMVNAVAKAEGLVATDEELEKGIVNIAKVAGKPLPSVKREFAKDPGMKDRLRSQITFGKVADFLVNNSEVREYDE
jgi:trigger factor